MSNEVDILKFTSDQLTAEKLCELISDKRSFRVVQVREIAFVVNKLESEIEKQDLRCRVYTEYRAAAIGGALVVPTGATQITGIATAIGVGVHNLATINPDYEIAKNKFKDTVTVMYQKS